MVNNFLLELKIISTFATPTRIGFVRAMNLNKQERKWIH